MAETSVGASTITQRDIKALLLGVLYLAIYFLKHGLFHYVDKAGRHAEVTGMCHHY